MPCQKEENERSEVKPKRLKNRPADKKAERRGLTLAPGARLKGGFKG